MAVITLYGRLSDNIGKVLTGVMRESKAEDIAYNEDSIDIQGSVQSIESALFLISEADVIRPDFRRYKSSAVDGYKARSIMSKAKEKRFEALLSAKTELKPCFGNMAYRKLTPKTTRSQEEEMLQKISVCAICNCFQQCGVMTTLRMLAETRGD
jgi:hypothetical protein